MSLSMSLLIHYPFIIIFLLLFFKVVQEIMLFIIIIDLLSNELCKFLSSHNTKLPVFVVILHSYMYNKLCSVLALNVYKLVDLFKMNDIAIFLSPRRCLILVSL